MNGSDEFEIRNDSDGNDNRRRDKRMADESCCYE